MEAKIDERSLLLEKARALKPLLIELEETMESERRLPEALRRAFLDADLYMMWAPRSCGGLEVDPITYFEVIEEIASVSGSAAWNLMLGSSYCIFAGAMPDEVAQIVFSDPECILAGQISGANGRAVAVPGGYRISGQWAFGSGILQSTYVLSNVTVYDGDQPRLDNNGRPVARFVLVPSKEVQIRDTWHTLGLCGTGSNDYVIDDVFAPEAFVFERGKTPNQAGPLYKLVGAFAYTIPLPILGMARGAVEAFKTLARTRRTRSGAPLKDSEIVQFDISRAESLLTSARLGLWAAVGEMYETARRGETITAAQEQRASLAQVEAAHLSVQAVDIIFDLCGGGAIYKGHPLERRFRDVHTAKQHAAVGRGRRLMIGADLLAHDA